MNKQENPTTSKCNFGDQRLTQRAVLIEEKLSKNYGVGLSSVFETSGELKRAYEFFANEKTSFRGVSEPYCEKTASRCKEMSRLLVVQDTAFLDYKDIKIKRDEYGPIGNGGNGLILHTGLGVSPENGQPMGILAEKMWHREHEVKKRLSKKEKKKKQAEARKRPIEEKESYKWIQIMKDVDKIFHYSDLGEIRPKLVHIFDREGDIAEVLFESEKMPDTELVVRASHNRALSGENDYLWSWLPLQPIKKKIELLLAKTASRDERTAKLALRYQPVKLKSPARLLESDYFEVYAVYVAEIDPPEGCEPINWMLLTTEPVTNNEEAETILRWYTYRWRIEEYHKILKSGCKAESYRLSGDSMQVLLGFLTKIAAQLLKMTYLNRTNPSSPASEVLNEVEIEVLRAKSRKPLTQADLTVSWAIGAVASLGGYLSHRKKSNIGITVLWRGLRELQIICEGWLLHKNL